LREDVARQRRQQVVEDLLILGNPSFKVRIGNLLIRFLRRLGDGLGRDGCRGTEEVEDLGALES